MTEEAPISDRDARTLRFLKILVTVLTATMILGVLAIVALLVIRLQRPDMELPPAIALPAGTAATAFTHGPDWIAVVTGDDRILIYDRRGTTLRQEIAILPAP